MKMHKYPTLSTLSPTCYILLALLQNRQNFQSNVFFFLDFQEFLTLFALLKPFMIFCGILTFLVSSRFFSFLRVEVLKRRAKELEKLSQRKPQRSVPNSRQNFPNHLQKSSPTFSSQKR